MKGYNILKRYNITDRWGEEPVLKEVDNGDWIEADEALGEIDDLQERIGLLEVLLERYHKEVHMGPEHVDLIHATERALSEEG